MDYQDNLDNYDTYVKSGQITAKVRELGASLIKPGVRLLDVCNQVEAKIKDLGGLPAFPAQVSINSIAAHYCPHPNDDAVFKVGDMAKLDVGVHVDGFVTDSATTVDLGNNKELTMASKAALNNAIKLVAPGVSVSVLGKEIQNTIESYGFSPIKNLSGHGVGKFIIHGPPTIPNYNSGDNVFLQKGQVIAIEPFATDGKGMITEGSNSSIFMVSAKKPIRSQVTRDVFKEISKYNSLPFTTRWLTGKFPAFKVSFALKELIQSGIIKSFPPLPEVKKGMVSQHEHTVFVDEKPTVLTKELDE